MYKNNTMAPGFAVAVLPATGFEASGMVWLAGVALLIGLVLVRIALVEPRKRKAPQ